MAETEGNDEETRKYKDILQRYAVQHHLKDLQDILAQDDIEDYYSIPVDALTLFESDMSLCDMLLSSPLRFLAIFDSALIEAQQAAMDVLPASLKRNLSVKRRVHARIMSLPVCPELTRVALPHTSDVGNFLSISGTVIRTTVVKMLEREREFSCTKCRTSIVVQADIEQYFSLPKPTHCTNEACNSTTFTSTSEKGGSPLMCRNYQEVKVQEQVQKLAMGVIPRAIWVVLEDDLVDACKAGDDVIICGIVRQRWKHLTVNNRCDIELVLQGNHVRVINEQKNNILITEDLRSEVAAFWEQHRYRPLTARNQVLASLCPQVYGLYVVKLAVAMVLAGGVQRVDESGTKVRGEAHLLLVGDPGTGKSQFLKYAAKITPRSVLTTGIGSTSAGLTVTAVKDSGEWQLEAGALVLADAGLCCIDEFNSIREHDKASIHEAMEQQTISVAKAGLVCKLNTRTTILAAANPKGHYDLEQSLCVNVALASPLLSRFDLVLVLVDSQNEDWDRHVSSYILENKDPRAASAGSKSLWSMERMQAYFALIKTFAPRLNQDSGRVLQAYYRAQRGADERNAARTSMRLLQSMIRLAQAHARLMFREEVTVQDAVVAVTVMESSMQGAALLGGLNVLHTSFPEDCEAEYMMQAEMILNCLGLPDLLERETERLRQERAAAEQEERSGGGGEDPKGPAMQTTPAPPSHGSREVGTLGARVQDLQGPSQPGERTSVGGISHGNQTSTDVPADVSGSQGAVSFIQGGETLRDQTAVRDSSVLSQCIVRDSVAPDGKISDNSFHQSISPSAASTGRLDENSRPQELAGGVEGSFTKVREKGEVRMEGTPQKENSAAAEASNKAEVSPDKLQLLKKFSFVSKAKLSHSASAGVAGAGSEEQEVESATGGKQGQSAGARAAQSAMMSVESNSSISHTIQQRIDQRASRAQTKVTDVECKTQSNVTGLPESVDREAKLVCVKDKGAGKTAGGKTKKLVTKLKEKFNVTGKDKNPFPTANIFSNDDDDDDDLFDLDIGFVGDSKQLSREKTKSAGGSSSREDVSPQVSKKATKRKRGSDPESAADQEKEARHKGSASETLGKRSRKSKPRQTADPDTSSNQSHQKESSSDISMNGAARAVSSSTIQKLKNFSFGPSSSSSGHSSSNSNIKPQDPQETPHSTGSSQEPSNAQDRPSVGKARGQLAKSSEESLSSHKGVRPVMTASSRVQHTQCSQRKGSAISESMLDSPLSSLASQPEVELGVDSSQLPLPVVGGTPSNSQAGNPAPPLITSTPLSFLTDAEDFPPPSSSPVPRVTSLAILPRSRPGQVAPWDRCGTKGLVSDAQESPSNPSPLPGLMRRVGHRDNLPEHLQAAAAVTTGKGDPDYKVAALEGAEVILNSQESLVSDHEEASSRQTVQAKPAGPQSGKAGQGSLQPSFSRLSGSKPSWLVKLNARPPQHHMLFPLDDKDDGLDDLDLELDLSRPVGTKPGRKS